MKAARLRCTRKVAHPSQVVAYRRLVSCTKRDQNYTKNISLKHNHIRSSFEEHMRGRGVGTFLQDSPSNAVVEAHTRDDYQAVGQVTGAADEIAHFNFRE